MSATHARYGLLDFSRTAELYRTLTNKQRAGVLYWCRSEFQNDDLRVVLSEVWKTYARTVDKKTSLDVMKQWDKMCLTLPILSRADCSVYQMCRLLAAVPYASAIVCFTLLRLFATVPHDVKVDMLEFVGTTSEEGYYLDFAAICKVSNEIKSVFLTTLEEHHAPDYVEIGKRGSDKKVVWSKPQSHDVGNSSALTLSAPSPQQ